MRIFRSVFFKFLLAQVPLFLILTGLGLHVLSEYRITDARQQMGVRIGGLAGRIAGQLADTDLQAEADSANRLISLLMADRGVACVEVLKDRAALSGISAPRLVGCRGNAASQFMEIPIGLDDSYGLKIGISTEEIDLIRTSARDFGWLIVSSGLLLSLIAAGISFRTIVSRPLLRLLSAINEVARTGIYQPVGASSKDDIGVLIDAFNTMQESLSGERARVQGAMTRIRNLYDTTPALLFAIDRQGTVVSVSQYWLDATGYRRSDVVGRSFTLLIAPESRKQITSDLMLTLEAGGTIREMPVQLCLSDGSYADMLLSVESADQNALQTDEFVCVMSDVTRLKVVERELRELALTDFLTKLPNRFGMGERMRQLAAMPEKARGTVAVLLIDLDNFKWVNDTYGHDAGDQLLIEATRRITAAVRPNDMVVRLGGDEFAIICAQLEGPEQANAAAGRVIDAFTAGIIVNDSVAYVGASIGIAVAPQGRLKPEELLRQADQAMYAAKLEGKNRFAIFSTAHKRDEETKSLQLRKIQDGLEDNAFQLHYQPLLDLKSLKIVGMEALLRLPSPLGGYEPTEPLIRVAEESGMIERLGHWVLREAAREFTEREPAGVVPMRLTVNMSARQLTGEFVARLHDLLAEFPILKDHLCLEITETAAIKRFELVNETLTRIRACGVQIAIDDFGVGFSSLSYIARLPIDMIKLDRSLVRTLDPAAQQTDETRKGRALVQATAALALELGVPLVAEGIENAEVLNELVRIGVPMGQGYMFSPALPMPQFADWFTMFSNKNKPPVPESRARRPRHKAAA